MIVNNSWVLIIHDNSMRIHDSPTILWVRFKQILGGPPYDVYITGFSLSLSLSCALNLCPSGSRIEYWISRLHIELGNINKHPCNNVLSNDSLWVKTCETMSTSAFLAQLQSQSLHLWLFAQNITYNEILAGSSQTNCLILSCSYCGRNPANQLRLVVYPIIYKVSYIPGGAGFLPSIVSLLHCSPQNT